MACVSVHVPGRSSDKNADSSPLQYTRIIQQRPQASFPAVRARQLIAQPASDVQTFLSNAAEIAFSPGKRRFLSHATGSAMDGWTNCNLRWVVDRSESRGLCNCAFVGERPRSQCVGDTPNKRLRPAIAAEIALLVILVAVFSLNDRRPKEIPPTNQRAQTFQILSRQNAKMRTTHTQFKFEFSTAIRAIFRRIRRGKAAQWQRRKGV